MAYNSPATSATSYGAVRVGSNINVAAGVISLPQSVDVTATPTFATVTSTGAVTDSGNRVITTLLAGPNITITGTAPTLTITAAGVGTVNTNLVTATTYTAVAADYYIGVTNVLPVVITLPTGIAGKTYIVKDELGPTSGGVTVTGTAGQLIDGALTSVIAVPFGSETFIFRGTAWHLV